MFRGAKPRVVILGTGWGGNKLARRLNKDMFDVRMISPANHFLMTPLLPSTAVGTLEFRAIQEPVRTIPGLQEYYQAKARELDVEKQTVLCEDVFKGNKFEVPYDYLCIAAGNKTNTFNTPGVADREGQDVFFLKHLFHARQIRNRILECFERASNPTITQDERDRLLSFILVGGGPTSCEFTSELHDFLVKDVVKWYPDLVEHIQISLLEAGPGLLGPFDRALGEYYEAELQKQPEISVMTGSAVTAVEENSEQGWHSTVAKLADGNEIPFGMMVWSAGLAPVRFTEKLDLPKHPRGGRIIIDDYMRVPGSNGRIFAIGDCAAHETAPLPPTAIVAEQQGQYLGDCFNLYYKDFDVVNMPKDAPLPSPGPVTPALMPLGFLEILDKLLLTAKPEFQYKIRGSMASMGFGGGVADLTQSELVPLGERGSIKGAAAVVAWRATYWTKQLSWSNMILVPMHWFKALIFGRDISRF